MADRPLSHEIVERAFTEPHAIIDGLIPCTDTERAIYHLDQAERCVHNIVERSEAEAARREG